MNLYAPYKKAELLFVILFKTLYPHQFDFRGALFQNGEAIAVQFKRLTLLWQLFKVIQNIARKRLILIILRQIQIVELVHGLHLYSPREFKGIVVYLLRHNGATVVFVLKIAQNLLYKVLKGYQSACTAKLVHNDGNALLFGKHLAHHVAGKH